MSRINLAWAASRSSSSERRQKRFFESIKPKAILAVDKSARSRALIMIDWFSKTTGRSFQNGTERESARIVWTRLYFDSPTGSGLHFATELIFFSGRSWLTLTRLVLNLTVCGKNVRFAQPCLGTCLKA